MTTKSPVSTQSQEPTVSEDPETTTALALSPSEMAALVPADISALQRPVHQDSAPAERRSISVPYVGFRGLKSFKHAEALDAAGIRVEKDGSGKFYLHHVTPIRVDPFKIHLFQYSRAYTRIDNNQNVTDAIFESDNEAFADGFREALYAAVAVVLSPGNYMPATLQLRGAQANALRDAVNLMPSAEQPKKLAARGLKVYACTIPPHGVTSSDNYSTLVGQTTAFYEPNRVLVNDWIRTRPVPLAGYLELADTVESSRNSGLWAVNATANWLTDDGTHPTALGHARMGVPLTALIPLLTL